MTLEEHIKQLKQQSEQLQRFIDRDLPRLVGVEAVNFFTESFQNEGFTDETLEPWKEVKRRLDSRNFKTITRGKNKGVVRAINAAGSRKILTGATGDLGRSIEYKAEPGQVTIISDTKGAGSDKDYAAAHNEGTTTAGRNRNVTIPKRQFIGKSATLDRQVMEIMKEGADKIIDN